MLSGLAGALVGVVAGLEAAATAAARVESRLALLRLKLSPAPPLAGPLWLCPAEPPLEELLDAEAFGA